MSVRSVHVEYPLRRAARGLLAAWCLFLIGGFLAARSLEPDPRGYGTHQRLGLPECGFRMMFHVPCPSCGMTTSFAHFTRGHWRQAAAANPAGLLLAVLCLIQIPWGLVSVARGRLWKVSHPSRTVLWVLAAVGLLALAQWTVRLMS